MNYQTSACSGSLLLVSSSIVVYVRPSAAGSGLPELIGFLNGTFMRRIFNLKTFIAKFVSCFLSVGSGMPVGPEGPMIHLGSIIGAGLSQFQSKTLGVKLPYFERFRNPEDRRNFISAGAAAGIASAFGAPVGGLLFAMEEMSSFWSMELSWQVLFCSMISAFTTDLFNSSFQNFRYTGSFGLFKTNQYILFQIDSGIDLNIIGVVPAVMLGVLGGLLGSLFITINLRLSRARLRLLSKMPTRRLEQLLKLGEPLAIVLVYTTVSVLLPAAFPCTPLPRAGASVELRDVESYTCPANTSYNQAATLFFLTGEKAIQHLFSRDTHLEFGYSALVVVLGLYFLFSCWSAGTNISSGLMVPMILIGALYGRLLGRACVDMFGVLQDGYWDWLDPGAFALLGAVSFMGGVTRLTMSLAVIMVEITNDIQFLILIIVTIMFAKWTGDIFTHSLYHALMEHKHIPYLPEHAPQLGGAWRGGVRQVMSAPVVTVRDTEHLATLATLLRTTRHGGFPVTNEAQQFVGLITRLELMVILCKAVNTRLLLDNQGAGVLEPNAEYSDIAAMRGHYLADPALHRGVLDQVERAGGGLQLRLSRYINTSALAVPDTCSLQRTYTLVRVLGLRHLTVVDTQARVRGVVTRGDLQSTAWKSERLADLAPIHSEDP